MIICPVFLLAYAAGSYCEDDSSSGVLVFGSSEQSSSAAQSSGTDSSVDDVLGQSESDTPEAVVPYEISGSSIGSTKVSQGVTIPSQGEIMFVDAGLAKSLVIVRVSKDGRETQVLNTSPERAIGFKLSQGTYKAYPEDLDGEFPLDKLNVMVQVVLTGVKTEGSQ
jgi:hypothetical protein